LKTSLLIKLLEEKESFLGIYLIIIDRIYEISKFIFIRYFSNGTKDWVNIQGNLAHNVTANVRKGRVPMGIIENFDKDKKKFAESVKFDINADLEPYCKLKINNSKRYDK
jgi:hypothetical protein